MADHFQPEECFLSDSQKDRTSSDSDSDGKEEANQFEEVPVQQHTTHVSYISDCSDVRINPSTENHYTMDIPLEQIETMDDNNPARDLILASGGPRFTFHTHVWDSSKILVKPVYKVHLHQYHAMSKRGKPSDESRNKRTIREQENEKNACVDEVDTKYTTMDAQSTRDAKERCNEDIREIPRADSGEVRHNNRGKQFATTSSSLGDFRQTKPPRRKDLSQNYVISAMESHKGDKDVQTLGRLTQVLLSQTASDIHQYLSSTGGCVIPVLSAMNKHIDDNNVQAIGCFALARMVENVPEIQKDIYESRGINQVMLAMSVHADDETVQASGCETLGVISHGVPKRQRYVCDIGGVLQVLSAMDRHEYVGSVQANACFALGLISEGVPYIQNYVYKNEGVARVLTAMNAHVSDEDVQMDGWLALAYISIGIQKIQKCVFDSGVVTRILSAMQANVWNVDVQLDGCLALAYLSQGIRDIQTSIFNNGGVALVLTTMRVHICDEEVQMNGCLALACISQGVREIQEYVCHNDGVAQVLSAMKRHATVWEVQRNGCFALSSMSKGVPDIQKYICDNGGKCCQLLKGIVATRMYGLMDVLH